MTYPAKGGLAAETVTTTYANATGVAQTLVGAQSYVSGTVYDNSGRVDTRTVGTGTTSVTRDYTYDADRRLSGWKATTGAGAIVQDDRLVFDDNGNVTERHDARTAVNQRECFGYDPRQRLTRAYTTTAAACGTPNASGPAPYDHTYTYAVDGKLTSRIQSGVTSTYTYPAQGTSSVRPHAVSSVGSSSYAYDPNGQLTSRPGGSSQQTLAWDVEHRMTTVTDGAATTSFNYDADGQRILRQDASSTVLYIEGHEFTRTGTTVKGKRYYTMGGVTVAVRDANTAQVSYLLGDDLGSTSMTVNASTGAVAGQRYLPYGAVRSSSGTQATERGWIGQTKDSSTGLQYLNARYYDPVIGRFTAVDPLADLTRPATLDSYGYSSGSPVTLSDPTGLLNELGGGGSPLPANYFPKKRLAEAFAREVRGNGLGDFVGGIGSGIAAAPRLAAGLAADVSACAILDHCDFETGRGFLRSALDTIANPSRLWRACDEEGARCAGELLGGLILGGLIKKALGSAATTGTARQRIFRAVEPDELASLKGSGAFRTAPGLEGKYFWPTRAQADDFAAMASKADLGGPYCVVSGCIPTDVLRQIEAVPMDGLGPAYFIPEEYLPLIDDVILNGAG